MSPARVTQFQYVAYAAIALGIVLAMFDSVLGFMVLPVTIGAAGIAMVLAIFHARRGRLSRPPTASAICRPPTSSMPRTSASPASADWDWSSCRR